MASMCLVISNMRLYIRVCTDAIKNARDEEVRVTEELREELLVWLKSKYITKTRSWLEPGVVAAKTVISTDASSFAGGIVINDLGINETITWSEGDAIARSAIHLKEAWES
ncbi:Oidioi.mRNA.OKI2018_I69.YSR.g17086.t1.cds [Oikopleura dioica]|uniref:Oidioi.mRNA.OKI2018_I69.YSR.g17086.t1.cds n=1 Tax=Oikopleura dioica TaxID=34765 RepID=A0ABN7SMC9_OIKDI|nr:Oidioi.mRNA.OKI2018_I69.YSR.g17086.t1.cds [Oikopleura dioica]